MSLIIRKKSAYTWEHYFDGATVPYITNVFNINNGGNNTFQLVDYRGSNLQAVPIADITLYDDTSGGIAETFATFTELNTRLGILQYPPMKTSSGGGGVESVSGVLVNNTDPVNPIVNGLIVEGNNQIKEIDFVGATVVNDGGGKVTVTVTGGGATPTLQEVLTQGNNTTKDIQFEEDTVSYIPRRIFSNNTEYGDTTFEVFINDPDGNSLYGFSHKDNTTGELSFVRLRTDLLTLFCSDNAALISGFEMSLSQTTLYGNVGDKGLVGIRDFSAYYDNLTYVQKIYVDNAIAGVTTPDATTTVKGIAKLYNSLGSNTDGAVDQNTVNSALDLKANLQNVEQFIRSKSNGTFGSHTGDTAETVIAVIDIDANEFEAGDWMTLLFSGEKDATAGNVTWRLRAGVNGNTSDALIAFVTASALNSKYTALNRVRPQFLTGNLLRIFGVFNTAVTDINTSGAPSLVSLNPTTAWKLTVTAQLTVSTETASLTGYRIGKIKSF